MQNETFYINSLKIVDGKKYAVAYLSETPGSSQVTNKVGNLTFTSFKKDITAKAIALVDTTADGYSSDELKSHIANETSFDCTVVGQVPNSTLMNAQVNSIKES